MMLCITGLVLIGSTKHPSRDNSTKCHGSPSPCSLRRQQLETYLKSSRSKESSIDIDNLPEFTSEQVAKRNGHDGAPIWMSYGGFVIDVTDFIPLHPGGTERISRAAGAAIEPFWFLHQQHFDTEEPLQIMRGLIVGKLALADQEKLDAQLEKMEAEFDAFQLILDLSTIGGGVKRLSLDDLKALPRTDVKSQVGCTQNQDRRPVSTTLCGGVRMSELLPLSRKKLLDPGQVLQLTFRAMDGETVSTDVANCEDILVCYEMDGAPLTNGRGFPIRIVIPGRRVVKWVERIEATTTTRKLDT